MKILFIQTGGTIDKDYPHTTKGWAFEFGEPAVERILEKLKPSFEFEVLTVCEKDSLEVTDDDREELKQAIQVNKADAYIITHGTDTMLETAEYLNNASLSKRILITGAMLPERFSNSEAAINVGAAIGAANLIESGIYISMHGIVKPIGEIKRNMETGKFF
jgi:L-asparaginase